MKRKISARILRHGLNLWPPFLFTGIHVTDIADDWHHARVELRMRPWNRNYVGTHFGGSLFAMTDPFWMLLVLHALGDDYIVWDRAGAIEFNKPGRGTVTADIHLDPAVIDEIRDATANGEKLLRWFECEIRAAEEHAAGEHAAGEHAVGKRDGDQEVVARVRKQLYVRRKQGR